MKPLEQLIRLTVFCSLTSLLVLTSVRTGRTQVRGISYTFSPEVIRMQWDNDAALANAYLYGGELGLGFGRFLTIGGGYFVGPNVESDFEGLDILDVLPDRDVKLRRYGGRLRLNLSTQEFVPYLSAGAGVLRFDPDGADVYKSIYTTLGAGLTFSPADRYSLSLGGELLSYRYSPSALFFDGLDGLQMAEQTVHSPSLTASLALHIGGRSPGTITALDRDIRQQFSGGLSSVRILAEPFYGRINFNEALNFPKDQNLYGINAGVQLGPYIGLRGFYWRGSEGTDFGDEFGEGFEDISMYGGELKLLLDSPGIEGITPYIMVGGGHLDIISGYDEEIPPGTIPPVDRFFASGGAGVELPLFDAFRLTGGIRSLLMSNDDAGDVSQPGELYGSWMYTAGLTFSLGGRSRPPLDNRPSDMPADEQAAVPEESEPAPQDSMALQQELLTTRIDSLERALQGQQEMMQQYRDSIAAARSAEIDAAESMRGDITTETAKDSIAPPEPPAAAPQARAAQAPDDPRRSNLSDRVLAVPVPEIGEIYIRVGEMGEVASGTTGTRDPEEDTVIRPVILTGDQQTDELEQTVPTGALTVAQVEEVVRQVMREQTQQQAIGDTLQPQPLTAAEVQRTVRETVREVMAETPARDDSAVYSTQINRLENEIQELRSRLNQQAEELTETRRRTQEDQPQPAATVDTSPDDDQSTGGPFRSVFGRPLVGAFPYTGFRFGGGFQQLQIGIRGDYRTSPDARLRFLPEFNLGLGDGISFTLLANAAYGFGGDFVRNRLNAPLLPYVGVGVGLAKDEGSKIDGVSNILLGAGYETNVGTFFTEYSTLDWFDVSRLHVGYRVRL